MLAVSICIESRRSTKRRRGRRLGAYGADGEGAYPRPGGDRRVGATFGVGGPGAWRESSSRREYVRGCPEDRWQSRPVRGEPGLRGLRRPGGGPGRVRLRSRRRWGGLRGRIRRPPDGATTGGGQSGGSTTGARHERTTSTPPPTPAPRPTPPPQPAASPQPRRGRAHERGWTGGRTRPEASERR